MKIAKTECSYHVIECDLKFGEDIVLDGEKLIPMSVIIDALDEMDLADYDYHTIQAIKQILNGDEATH